MTSRATAYAELVLSDDIVAGRLVKAACQRHIDDLARDDLRYNQAEEDRLVAWYPKVGQLVEPADLAGQPTKLVPHQEFFFGQLRAWQKQMPDGSWGIRFNRALLLSGRGGAGKTASIGPYILYYIMCLNKGDPMPEAYVLAEQHPQTYPLMDHLWEQILRNEKVAPYFSMQQAHQRPLIITLDPKRNRKADPSRFSKGQIQRVGLSAKSGNAVRGPKPSLMVIEEGQSAKGWQTVKEFLYGSKNRPWPLVLTLSNAGHDKTTPLGVQYEEAEQGLLGKTALDDGFLPLIFESDLGEEVLAQDKELIEEELRKANPLYPVSPRPNFVWPKIEAAQKDPAQRVDVLNQVFCVWTEASEAWLTLETIMACEKEQMDIPSDARLFLGLDLSQRQDLTALAELYVWPEGRAIRGHCWLPLNQIDQKTEKDRVLYRSWAGEDPTDLNAWLTLTPGDTINYGSVVKYIEQLLQQPHPIVGIAGDQWKMKDLQQAMDLAGVGWTADHHRDGLYTVLHPQGIAGGGRLAEFAKLPPEERDKLAHAPLWMPKSLNVLEDWLLEKEIWLDKNPMLRWSLQSMEVKQDTQLNKFPVRAPSSGGKIDLAMAAVMASGLCDAWLDSEPQGELMDWIDLMRQARTA